MRDYLSQYRRVERALQRIENQNRNQTEYEDDLWSFFQNCHHLKDWVINDDSIEKSIRDQEKVEGFVYMDEDLRICADLANRSKHLELKNPKEEAKVTNTNVKICPAPARLLLDPEKGTLTQTNLDETGFVELEYIITLKDSRKRIALDVAKKAVSKWTKFLLDNSLPLDG
jgi:hypothetical protein